ncbi:metallophosphoesterase [Paenibacillus sp. V4I5]|uniref:metallophosphoesterase n=1 Tax=Paenibacillus sp. V4I5 TaxID=3042306 RepID=UPI0035934078
MNDEKPNLIFVTGDFTKRRTSLSKLEKYLRAMTISNVPIYCVLGNHDYQQKNVNAIINLLRKYGLHLLIKCRVTRTFKLKSRIVAAFFVLTIYVLVKSQ